MTVTAPAERLLIVRLVPPLCTPTFWEPRFADGGTVSAPVTGPPVPPVPETENDCGLPTPLLEMLIWPERAPVAAGVNWMLTEQLPVGGSTNAPAVQVVLTTGNSSGLLLVGAEMIWTAALPVIVMLRACTALPTPTACEPKFIAAGMTSAADAPPANVCR